MPLVKKFMDGNCQIEIYDDYMAKTEEENNKILDNIAKIYVDHRLKELEKAAECK